MKIYLMYFFFPWKQRAKKTKNILLFIGNNVMIVLVTLSDLIRLYQNEFDIPALQYVDLLGACKLISPHISLLGLILGTVSGKQG